MPHHDPRSAPILQEDEQATSESSSSSSIDVDPALAKLAEEVTRRLVLGERVDLDRLESDHPQWADEIRDLLPAMRGLVMLEEAVDPSAAQPVTGDWLGEHGRVFGDFRIVRETDRGPSTRAVAQPDGGSGVIDEAVRCDREPRRALDRSRINLLHEDRNMNIVHCLLICFLIIGIAPSRSNAQAQAETYQTIKTEYKEATAKFIAERKARSAPGGNIDVADGPYPRFAGRFLAFAEKHPQDPAAIDALNFVVEWPDGRHHGDLGDS